MPRAPRLLLAGLGAAAVAGCGGTSRPPADPPAVQLTVLSPADTQTVHTETLEVRGRVSPARAVVQVLGRPAAVRGGQFDVTVPLAEGVNVVDVAASARGRSPALTALRVTRDTRVEVPDVTGADLKGAAARLGGLGLQVTEDRGGGLFDPLLPGPWRVCRTDPAAGAKVARGATVALHTAKRC